MRTLHRLSAIVLPASLGIVVSAIVAINILNHRKAEQANPPATSSGSPLPRGQLINLNTLHDEYQNVTKGTALLVFITTDCHACGKELVNASQAVPSLESKVAVYGVGIEDLATVKTFAEVNHVGFPMLLDPGAVIIRQLGFRLMPTKVLLKNGVIVKIWHGSSPDQNALIRDIGEVDTQ